MNPVAEVTGNVTDEDGNPVTDFAVGLCGMFGGFPSPDAIWRIHEPQGRFRLARRSGTERVFVISPEGSVGVSDWFGGIGPAVSTKVRLGDGTVGLRVVTLGSDGRAVPGMVVRILENRGTLSGALLQPHFVFESETDAHGVARFPSLPIGRVRIVAYDPRSVYGTEDEVVAVDTDQGEITLLAYRLGRMEGTAAGGSRLLVLRRDQVGRPVDVDSDGAFAVDGLLPGDYEIRSAVDLLLGPELRVHLEEGRTVDVGQFGRRE
jgi:hypothetical protein